MSDRPTNPIRDAIAEAIAENDVILFMKGTPEAPACGFSARTVAMLQSLAGTVRRGRHPARSSHPPGAIGDLELAHDSRSCSSRGELIGGCDIVTEMYESGELAEALGLEADEDAPAQPVVSEPQPAGFTQIENHLS